MKEDYTIINGKPYFGIWFGKALIVNDLNAWVGNPDENPILQQYIDSLKRWQIGNFCNELEIRKECVVFRPPYISNSLNLNGTIAIKFIIWGRAFKVMKLLKKGIKRYAKKMVNGKRKYVKINK